MNKKNPLPAGDTPEIRRRREAARRIVVQRARYMSSDFTDYDALDAWHDASAEYFNLTGLDHPMAQYARYDH